MKGMGDRKQTIEAKRQSPKSIYIRSVEWNGSPVSGLSIDHAQLGREAPSPSILWMKLQPSHSNNHCSFLFIRTDRC